MNTKRMQKEEAAVGMLDLNMREIGIAVLVALSVVVTPLPGLADDAGKTVVTERQHDMGDMWKRVKRISKYVDPDHRFLTPEVESFFAPQEPYDDKRLVEDAEAIAAAFTKFDTLWPRSTRRIRGLASNSDPVIWTVPRTFARMTATAREAGQAMVEAARSGGRGTRAAALCDLGKSCGTCHAVFRKVYSLDLLEEGRGWSGNVGGCR